MLHAKMPQTPHFIPVVLHTQQASFVSSGSNLSLIILHKFPNFGQQDRKQRETAGATDSRDFE